MPCLIKVHCSYRHMVSGLYTGLNVHLEASQTACEASQAAFEASQAAFKASQAALEACQAAEAFMACPGQPGHEPAGCQIETQAPSCIQQVILEKVSGRLWQALENKE